MELCKILTIMGTRPEAIKLAPVVRELVRRPERFVSRVCASAQHRELLDQALAPFALKPDFDLDAMTPGQSLAGVTARIVERFDRLLQQERPDVVLVQGDTTTALCGALTAYYHQVKVGHVEAGLRTGNKYAPFPEELNRSMIGRLADFHFAPTAQARGALLREGVDEKAIFVTGNTVIDALLWVRKQVDRQRPALPEGLAEALEGRQLVLITGHRRESFGKGFENICCAIRQVAESYPNVAFVYPVHLNPQVREPVQRILGGCERIHLTEPLAYEPFVWLMNQATVVLTDSGGVQEEAPSLGKPVLVMRTTTERPEGVAAGNARLVGVEVAQIVDGLSELLCKPEKCAAMAQIQNPYGDGKAAMRIVQVLEEVVGPPAEQ